MQNFIYEMINQHGLKGSQAIEIYETLQKLSKNSNLSVEEAISLVINK